MASYSVVIPTSASDELRTVPFPFRRQLNQFVYKLMNDPRPAAARNVGDDVFRVDVHGWFIVYEVDDAAMRITLIGFRKASA